MVRDTTKSKPCDALGNPLGVSHSVCRRKSLAKSRFQTSRMRRKLLPQFFDFLGSNSAFGVMSQFFGSIVKNAIPFDSKNSPPSQRPHLRYSILNDHCHEKKAHPDSRHGDYAGWFIKPNQKSVAR